VVEIIKVYKQEVPAMRFIGKKYSDEDRVDGGFGAKWGEWFANNWFGQIEQLKNESNCHLVYEDSDAYIGLMRHKEGEPFQYWIGIFMPTDTQAPEGFEAVDFPASQLGVSWVYGKEPEVYCKEGDCAKKLNEEGIMISADGKNEPILFMERYCCPRFTTPDEKGNIILDICFFIN
jgi:predicted transcriptional regulator YdeE